MPRIEITEYIDAPPNAVWEFISDPHRWPEWVTVTEELISVSEEPVKEGTTYREFTQVGPSKSETEWTITEFDEPSIQVHETHETDMEAELTMRVEPSGDGTRLSHITEYRLMPGFRPLGILLEILFARRVMESELRQTVTNVKRMIENEYEH